LKHLIYHKVKNSEGLFPKIACAAWSWLSIRLQTFECSEIVNCCQALTLQQVCLHFMFFSLGSVRI